MSAGFGEGVRRVRESGRERESVCVCERENVHVCVRDRDRVCVRERESVCVKECACVRQRVQYGAPFHRA